MRFPLKKLDLLAVPDFAMVRGAGRWRLALIVARQLAMENFGLVIYREARLLIDSSSSGAAVMGAVRTYDVFSALSSTSLRGRRPI